MFMNKKNGDIKKVNQRLSIKLGMIYFLLIILFIVLIIFL